MHYQTGMGRRNGTDLEIRVALALQRSRMSVPQAHRQMAKRKTKTPEPFAT